MTRFVSILEDIPSLLESQIFITSRWIACQYNVTIDEASEILHKYDTTNDSSLTKTYVLTGLNHDKVYTFVHVSENEIDNIKKKFVGEPARSIYSLQKINVSPDNDAVNSNTLSMQLAALDMEQTKCFLLNNDSAHSNHFLLNQIGGIISSSIKIQPMGIRTRSSVVRDITGSAVEPKSSLFPKPKVSTTTAPLKAPSIAVSNFFNKSSSSGANPTPDVATSVNNSATITANVTNTKTVTNKKEKETKNGNKTKPAAEIGDDDDDDATELAFEVKANPSKGSSNTEESVSKSKRKVVIDDGDEDEVWEDGNGKAIEVDKNLLKKLEQKKFEKDQESTEYGRVNKRLTAAEDEANAVESADATTCSNEVDEVDGTTRKIKKSKHNILQRGAMDDYFEDIAIAQEKERIVNGTSAAEDDGESRAVEPEKKKIKKLVEKVNTDDTAVF